ncbi:hypothetical protein LCGC14_2552920 [marine sediment metagenome]|uniref:Uncharacterized protein n=1 Tax=marine sediment metagenome TaxID=412755 RepID=A0A0F9DFF7_9ZZZZ
MSDIQEQFARFVERWRGYLDCDPAPSNSEHFEEELRDFILKFLEECCEAADSMSFLNYNELCKRFNEHFPWLESWRND